MKSATLSAGSFLVAVFANVQISMMTTPGYFMAVRVDDFLIPRIIGTMAFMIGLLSLSAMISLSGWTKSKKMGRFTTAVGILTLILLLVTMTRISL